MTPASSSARRPVSRRPARLPSTQALIPDRMPRVFGTDGVRGLANREVTAELALDLSVAAARVIIDRGDYDRTRERPLAVVGRDPRISGQILEHAVVAGLASAGVDVLRLRVVPTPGVAYLTDALDADLGVVISASHNPMPDNGIKFLARGGHKLDDAVEAPDRGAAGQRVGRAHRRRRGQGAPLRAPDRGVRRPPADARWTARSPGSRSSSTAPTAPPPRPRRWRCERRAPRSS